MEIIWLRPGSMETFLRLNQGKGVLVVSLNPHINPSDRKYHDRSFSADEWWNYWREFNLFPSNWSRQFFPRLVKLAAMSLGEEIPTAQNDIHQFATNRMLFVEFCPHASAGFAGLSWHQWKNVANDEPGFRIKRQVRQLIFDYGQPAMVFCNGQAAAFDVKDQQFGVHNMANLKLSIPEEQNHSMEVYSATYKPQLGRPFPVIGFNQLGRTASSPNIEMEIIRRHILRLGLKEQVIAEPGGPV